jgi:deoxycytidylate deaminase
MSTLEANPSFKRAILVVFASPMHIGEAYTAIRADAGFRPSYEEFIECVEELRLGRELVALPADQNRLVAATWPSVPVDDGRVPAAIYTSILDPVTCCMMVAHLVAKAMSKDPNTKVGAVVYDPVSKHMHVGYNGFPPGFPDTRAVWDCRDAKAELNKYRFVKHAEANAISKAMKAGADLTRCWLIVTHHPCHRCMVDFVASNGIKKVHYASDYPPDTAADLVAKTQGVEMIHEKDIMLRIKDFVTDMRMFA